MKLNFWLVVFGIAAVTILVGHPVGTKTAAWSIGGSGSELWRNFTFQQRLH